MKQSSRKMLWGKPLHPFVSITLSVILMAVFLVYHDYQKLLLCLAAIVGFEILFGMGKMVCLSGIFYVPSGILIALALAWVTMNWHNSIGFLIQISALWAASTVTLCTTPMDFVHALMTARAPRAITLGMLVMMRTFPILKMQCILVWKSWKMLRYQSRHNQRSVSLLRLAFPIMERVLTISENLSNAVEMRCFRFEPANDITMVKPVSYSWVDVVFPLLIALSIGGIIFW